MNGSEEGMRCRQHLPFFVSILRKIVGFLKLVDEKYGPLKKAYQKILGVGTSCHPYISNNFILDSTTLSLKKATV